MWYAVETAFMNGRMLKSVPMFDPKTDENTTGRIIPGTCPLSHDEEPRNTCQKFLNGLVEIHTDWFQTKKQAMQFINGGITYIMHYRAVYRKDIKSTIRTFLKWEAVPALGDRLPYRGIYMDHKEGEQVKPVMEQNMTDIMKSEEPVKPVKPGEPVEFVVNEIINWVHSDYKDRLVKLHHIKGDTEDEAFRKVYALRRSGRYDNVRRYDFADPAVEERYRAWKDANEDITMYYGGGTVD